MELNRFKQLLESTMGNVKPLIMEQPTGDTPGQITITSSLDFSATDNQKPIGFSYVDGGTGVSIMNNSQGVKTKGGNYMGVTDSKVGFTYVNIPQKLNDFEIILADKKNQVLATYGPFPTQDVDNYISKGLKFRGMYKTSPLPKGIYKIYVKGDDINSLDITVA